MNDKNLIPNSERTPSERRENAKKAGIASGKARRKNREIKEICKIFMEMPIKNGKLDKIKNIYELENKNITVEEAMVFAQIKKALDGDISSFNVIVDLSGKNNNQQDEKTEDEPENNSFINALNGKAAEVWNDEEQEE